MKTAILKNSLLLYLLCFVVSMATYANSRYPIGTYFGGGGFDKAMFMATDLSGNIIVVGITRSDSLPGTEMAYQKTRSVGFPDNYDIFVSKFDAEGKKLLWTSFLGGEDYEYPTALAINKRGEIILGVSSQSTNFPSIRTISCTPPTGYINFNSAPPLTKSCQMNSVGKSNAKSYLAKFSADGSQLVWSIGLENMNSISSINADASSDIYFSTVGPWVTQCIFLFRLNDSGRSLIYGALIGGGDIGFSAKISSIVIDKKGDVYLGGIASQNIPVTSNALQNNNSNKDLNSYRGNGFILKLDPDKASLIYGTWFGLKYSVTEINNIYVQDDESIYFSGSTDGSGYTPSPDAFYKVPGNGFVAKLVPGATSLSEFTYLPESPIDMGMIVRDSNIFLGTNSTVIGLKIPSISASSEGQIYSTSDFSFAGVAAGRGSKIWILGNCLHCQLDDAIPSTAFQSNPAGNGDLFILELKKLSPSISHVLGAATGEAEFSSSQIVSIYGDQIGSQKGVAGEVDSSGKFGNFLGETKVFFDGLQAPILYSSHSQINTIIPCNTDGDSESSISIEYRSIRSEPYKIKLQKAAPGIFTLNGSGTGPAVVVNDNNTLNGIDNPASKGSVIVFYATGILTRTCIDGQVFYKDFAETMMPVSVKINGTSARVEYSGQAPWFVNGLLQINVVLPVNIPSGEISLSLNAEGFDSASITTIFVE